MAKNEEKLISCFFKCVEIDPVLMQYLCRHVNFRRVSVGVGS